MIWVWNFILYSFFGFLLEVAYARATGGRGDRKSLLVLPLCPVYGVGACLILLLPRTVIQNPFTLFLLGGLAATAAEYGMAILYERGLGVSFWDYTGLPGSIQELAVGGIQLFVFVYLDGNLYVQVLHRIMVYCN